MISRAAACQVDAAYSYVSNLIYLGNNTPRITSAGCDRLGILNLTAELQVPAPKETQNSVLQQFLSLHSAPDIGINIPSVGISTPKFGQGNITFAWLYEGFNGDLTTSAVVCEQEGSDNQEPIETHPNILEIAKLFGGIAGSDGHITFPMAAPKGVDGPKGPDGKIRNPMSGADSYIGIGLTWRKQYLTINPSPSIFNRAGYIDIPTGSGAQQPPPLDSPRNWLKLAPRMRWRGNCWEVTEIWWASGRNGWVKQVYTAPAHA